MFDLLTFIKNSPSPFHVVREATAGLLKAGFRPLDSKEKFSLERGGKYFIVRDGSSLLAFIVPQVPKRAVILLSHVDRPGFRLKPQGEYVHENMILWPLEVYGSPVYTTWMNRDVQIAGRVFVDRNGKLEEEVISLEEYPMTITQLPIHLDRNVNTEGCKLSAQEHLHLLAGLKGKDFTGSYLESLLRKKISFTKPVHHELYLSSLDFPQFLGGEKNLFAATGIDNLCSVAASLEAIVSVEETECMPMIYCADHEEVGSRSFSGADTSFFSRTFQRIFSSLGLSYEDCQICAENSFALSLDGVHAFDPKYKDRFEPSHTPFLNGGVVLKADSSGSYADTSSLSAKIKHLADKHHYPLQVYMKRGDARQGSTLGPLFLQHTGIETLDLGIPQLSMHSIREVAAWEDYRQLAALSTLALRELS